MGYADNQKQLAKLGIISNEAADRAIAQNNAALTASGTTKRLNNLSKSIFDAIDQGFKEASQPIWERDSNVKILGENDAKIFKETVENIPDAIEGAIDQGFKEASQPIWERDSTVKVLGDDGADKLQDVFNPARWGENAIDDLGISNNSKDVLKKYLPVALAGGAALLLITALK